MTEPTESVNVEQNDRVCLVWHRTGFLNRKQGEIMRLKTVRAALEQKKITYDYTEEDGCGSLDFLFRGLKFHVWEFREDIWGAETNIFHAGRSQDIEGDYEAIIAKEILSWPDMIA